MSITIADKLRMLRQEKGLSQNEVADFLGISRPAYVKYETGNSQPVRKIKELCELFNVSSDYLLGVENEKANITGERLRKLREDKQLSQGDVAKLINISRSAYVAYETGRSRPIRRLDELCQLFNVTSDYILGKEANEPTEPKYSTDEKNLIEIYRKLDKRGKITILQNAKSELDILEINSKK